MSASKPFQQGQKDRLCGIYAGINSIKAVFGKTAKSEAELQEYMDAWVTHIGAKKFMQYFLNGMNFEQLYQELMTLKNVVYETKQKRHEESKEKGRIIYIDHVKIIKPLQFAKVVDDLVNDTDRSRCLIVGLSGKADHWTIVTDITRNGFTTFDSCGLEELVFKDLAIGDGFDGKYYYISPEFFIVSNGKQRKKT